MIDLIDLSRVERPSVFFVNGLGDQLIALPAMRALSAIFRGRMQLLLGEGNYSFMFPELALRDREPARVWWLDPDQNTVDVERIEKSAPRCDLFISLATWSSPSVIELAKRLGAKKSIGYFESFDHPLLFDRYGNMWDYLFAVPRALDPTLVLEDFSSPPLFSAAAENAAARRIAETLREGERMLFFHPESTDPKRSWSPDQFSWVLSEFLEARPEYRVFVCSVKPYPLALGRHAHRAVRHDGHLELTLASMRFADLFLGVDSCFLHAADLFRVPGAGVFGPTDPEEWGFRLSPRARAVWGRGSMEAIDRRAVLEALLEAA